MRSSCVVDSFFGDVTYISEGVFPNGYTRCCTPWDMWALQLSHHTCSLIVWCHRPQNAFFGCIYHNKLALQVCVPSVEDTLVVGLNFEVCFCYSNLTMEILLPTTIGSQLSLRAPITIALLPPPLIPCHYWPLSFTYHPRVVLGWCCPVQVTQVIVGLPCYPNTTNWACRRNQTS